MSERIETGFVELKTEGLAKVQSDLDAAAKANQKAAEAASKAAEKAAKDAVRAAEKAAKESAQAAKEAAQGMQEAFDRLAGGYLGFEGIKKIVEVVDAQQTAERKLGAVLKSTGDAAGYSSRELVEYANQLQQTTRFSEEATISAEAELASMGSISGPAFKRTISLAQDMATIFGGEVTQSIRQLGKALVDPQQGLDALRRVGVIFTADEKEMIKTLQQSGDLMGAQTFILDKLTEKFGGAAAAARDTFGGAIENLGHQWADLAKELAKTDAAGLSPQWWLDRAAAIAKNTAETIRLRRETHLLNQGGGGWGQPDDEKPPETLQRELLAAKDHATLLNTFINGDPAAATKAGNELGYDVGIIGDRDARADLAETQANIAKKEAILTTAARRQQDRLDKAKAAADRAEATKQEKLAQDGSNLRSNLAKEQGKLDAENLKAQADAMPNDKPGSEGFEARYIAELTTQKAAGDEFRVREMQKFDADKDHQLGQSADMDKLIIAARQTRLETIGAINQAHLDRIGNQHSKALADQEQKETEANGRKESARKRELERKREHDERLEEEMRKAEEKIEDLERGKPHYFEKMGIGQLYDRILAAGVNDQTHKDETARAIEKQTEILKNIDKKLAEDGKVVAVFGD